jgi:ABC-type Na+ efflux pump permease subunit
MRRDWAEYSKAVPIIMVGLALPVVMKIRGDGRPEFVEGMLYSFIVCAGWIYAQSCFLNERFRGTLHMLLALPLQPFELVAAKYASIYCMVLLTVNLPLIALRDSHLLLIANGTALFLATLVLSGTVLSRAPLAGQIPILVLFGLTFATEDNVQTYYPAGVPVLHWVFSHTSLLAILGLFLSPLIAVSVALWFQYRQVR